MSEKPISPLRARMIEDMTVRNFVEKTKNDYIRHVKTFAAFLGRSPHLATPEDLRSFQVHQTETGVRPPTINGSVAALRFFFTTTLGRPEMSRQLTFVREPRKIPVTLSPEEVMRLIESGGDAADRARTYRRYPKPITLKRHGSVDPPMRAVRRFLDRTAEIQGGQVEAVDGSGCRPLTERSPSTGSYWHGIYPPPPRLSRC